MIANNIEGVFENDPYIIEIRFEQLKETPIINYDNFEESSQRAAKGMVGHVVDFLSAPYIVDDFLNNRDRARWKQGIYDQYGQKGLDIIQNNCIRPTLAMWARHAARWIPKEYIGSNKKVLDEKAKLILTTYDMYKDMRIEVLPFGRPSTELVPVIEDLKALSYNFLEVLSHN